MPGDILQLQLLLVIFLDEGNHSADSFIIFFIPSVTVTGFVQTAVLQHQSPDVKQLLLQAQFI